MPIDLPKDSLGPKPTKKQMELLKKIAEPGITVHTYIGTRSAGGAFLKNADNSLHETLNQGTVGNFRDWGWLDVVEDKWNGKIYSASDRARKVIEKGVTRGK